LVLAVLLAHAIRAGASGISSTNALSYAGVLEDNTGPITGSHSVQVVLYGAASAGTILCQSTAATVTVTDGHFSMPLPDACTAAVGASPNAWVDVLVDGADTGRTPIGAVPYAVEANHAPNADNASSARNATPDGGIATAIAALQANTMSTVFITELNLTDPGSDNWEGFAATCINNLSNSNPTTNDALPACPVAANRKCTGIGYKGGWFVGEWGSSGDPTTRTIACLK
jgi:hypothetical protein